MAYLRDERLAPLAVGALPAWLWSLDATRIIWANPTGAAIFGAATSAAVSERVLDGGQPAAAQILTLATGLPENGQARIEHLHGFEAGFGRALACECSRIVLADGTQAILVAATEPVDPDLPLDEQVTRLLGGCDEPAAIFSVEGKLIHATPAADPYLLGAHWLAALGAAAAATDALRTGHAQERSVHGSITIDRIGREAATVLLTTFSPPSESDKIASYAIADARPMEPIAAEPAMSEQTVIEQTEILQAEPPAAPAPPPAASEPEPPASDPAPPASAPLAMAPAPPPSPLPAERRHPLRFVWQIDDDGRFTLGSEEFIALAGPRTAAALGRTWPEIAGELGLDPEGARRPRARHARHLERADRDVAGRRQRRTPRGRAVRTAGVRPRTRIPRLPRFRRLPRCRTAQPAGADAQRDRRLRRSPPHRSENVVRFPAAEAETTVEPGVSALSTREHHAFYELSRRLTHQSSMPTGTRPTATSCSPSSS